MKAIFILVLCFITETLLSKDVTTVDLVLRGLKDQSWSEDERPCLDQMLLILNNVRNYTVWAVWIWNSMHHPVGTFYGSQYSLGNYDQCLHAPSTTADPEIVTQYCLIDVILTGKKFDNGDRSVVGTTERFFGIKTNIGRNLNKLTWGTCLPSVCKPHSISKILKIIYLANPLTPAEPEIIVESCQISGEEKKISFGFYIFIFFITTLVAVSVYSTWYLQQSELNSGALHNLAESFNIKKNWKSLTKKSGEEIGVLNMLKVGLASLAVHTHTVYFISNAPISNGLKFDEMMLAIEDPFKNAVKHIDLPVDNFFMMSGLLLIKGLMEKRKKPLVALVNRYFRLTASFAIVMFYVASVSIYTGDGPVWQRFAGREQRACAENWWLGLLMINNYVNSENICLMVSWYIPCDYQLAVMGTLLYMIWQKNRSLAKVVTILTVVIAVLTPGIVTYWRRLPGLLLYHDLENMLDFRNNPVFVDTYIRSHNRAGPFLVGMAMGYIISVYKPDNYRNVISKRISFILVAVASIVSVKVLTAALSWKLLEYDHIESAMYAVYSRNLWALATCAMIGVVEYGDVAFLRKMTNWHGFTVISRLTFGIYLTHSLILHQNLYSRKNLIQFDYFEGIHSIGVMVMSAVLATFLWLFVETPMNNIVNLFINSSSQDKSKFTRKEEAMDNNKLKEL